MNPNQSINGQYQQIPPRTKQVVHSLLDAVNIVRHPIIGLPLASTPSYFKQWWTTNSYKYHILRRTQMAADGTLFAFRGANWLKKIWWAFCRTKHQTL